MRDRTEVTFGLNPPVFDAVRMPRETAARALSKALQEARDRRPGGSLEPSLDQKIPKEGDCDQKLEDNSFLPMNLKHVESYLHIYTIFEYL